MLDFCINVFFVFHLNFHISQDIVKVMNTKIVTTHIERSFQSFFFTNSMIKMLLTWKRKKCSIRIDLNTKK